MAQILLAEDDEGMRSFLTGALRRAGHEVVSVGDGLDALTKLTDTPFDLCRASMESSWRGALPRSSRA